MTQVAVAVLYRPNDNRFYIQQRKLSDQHSPGKWECPGGKVEEGETPQATLVRELVEELGIERLSFINELWLGSADVTLPHGSYFLNFFLCQLLTPDAIIPTSAEAWAWVAFGDLHRYDMLPADARAIYEGTQALARRPA